VVSVTPQPRFTPGERTPGTHCTGGWVGPRADLDTDAEEKCLASAGDRTSIARSSSPQPDTILTELPASCSLLYLKLKFLFVHSCHCEWLHRCTVHTVQCLRYQTLFFLHLSMCHSCTQSAQQVRRGCRPLCMTRESPHPVP
jgi:hypothetical protein